jgi:serine/threonine protein kinase
MPYSFEADTMNGRRPDDEHDPLIGTLIDGRYRIEGRIATGGFGAVYRACKTTGELVALKILHPRLTADPNMVARFQREGATLIQLHDPHTVATHEVGETPDGTLYIAMELLTGESLQDRLRRVGALPWRAAVAIARAVCSSLAEAHPLGIVHRDLKPSNIHVESRGASEIVKVIDFGIVKIARGSSIDDGQELTFAGHMIGTYDYMSPEQIVGAPCHDRSDIYSLGVVLYEMLTGRRPFPKVTGPASMLTALLTQTPIPPAVLAAIPAELDGIVMRCLDREPEHRFGSVVELARALDELAGLRATDDMVVVQPARAGADAPTYRETPGRDDGDSVTYREAPGRDDPGAPSAGPDDERTLIDRRGQVIDDGDAAPATTTPDAPLPVAAPRVTAPSVAAPRVVATSPTSPQRPLAARPGPSPQGSLGTTLQGVAVAPGLVRRSPPVAARTPHPAPFEWPVASHATSWPPAMPHEPAIGSSLDVDKGVGRQPLARSHALIWLALAIAIAVAGIAAIVLVAVR